MVSACCTKSSLSLGFGGLATSYSAVHDTLGPCGSMRKKMRQRPARSRDVTFLSVVQLARAVLDIVCCVLVTTVGPRLVPDKATRLFSDASFPLSQTITKPLINLDFKTMFCASRYYLASSYRGTLSNGNS